MKEVKNNKKPFIFYYTIVIVIMILLNMFVFPRVLSPTVKEVGYDTFLTMLDKKEIKQVQAEIAKDRQQSKQSEHAEETPSERRGQ